MNYSNRENKIIKYRKTFDDAAELAYERRENGDYVGALSIMQYEAQNGNNPDVYAHIADIYTQMEQYEVAIKYWYKFMLKSKPKYYFDAYNGLGANFFMAGNDALAGYYFNKQLENGSLEESVYEDVLEDYLDSLIDMKRQNYRVVYPKPQSETDEENYEAAKVKIDNQDYIGAIETLNMIGEESEFYLKAKTAKGYAYFYLNELVTAFDEVSKAIDMGEINIYSLTLAINLSALSSSMEEFGKYIDLLLDYKDFSDDDKYKKLNLLINLNLTKEALEYSEEIVDLLPYTADVRFLRGILFYNKKDYVEAEKNFRYSYIITLNPIIKYYHDLSVDAASGKVRHKKLLSEFEIPEKELLKRINTIKELYNGDRTAASKYPDDFDEIAKWVFAGDNNTVQIVVAILLAHTTEQKYLNILQDALIDPAISDEIKHRIVSIMCENNRYGEIAVVYGYIFRKIKIPENKFEGEGADIFRRAHAYAFGRLSVIEDKQLPKLLRAALKLQRKLIERGNIDKVTNLIALSCAIYITSDINLFGGDMDYKYFNAEKESVNEILNMAK